MTLSQFKAQLSLPFETVLGSQKIALSHPQILRVVNAKDEETVHILNIILVLGPKMDRSLRYGIEMSTKLPTCWA